MNRNGTTLVFRRYDFVQAGGNDAETAEGQPAKPENGDDDDKKARFWWCMSCMFSFCL